MPWAPWCPRLLRHPRLHASQRIDRQVRILCQAGETFPSQRPGFGVAGSWKHRREHGEIHAQRLGFLEFPVIVTGGPHQEAPGFLERIHAHEPLAIEVQTLHAQRQGLLQ